MLIDSRVLTSQLKNMVFVLVKLFSSRALEILIEDVCEATGRCNLEFIALANFFKIPQKRRINILSASYTSTLLL